MHTLSLDDNFRGNTVEEYRSEFREKFGDNGIPALKNKNRYRVETVSWKKEQHCKLDVVPSLWFLSVHFFEQ